MKCRVVVRRLANFEYISHVIEAEYVSYFNHNVVYLVFIKRCSHYRITNLYILTYIGGDVTESVVVFSKYTLRLRFEYR
jgi:hypothetical protein